MSQISAYLHHVFIQQFDVWIVVGFIAQGVFTARFIVQWIASERARRSVIPVAFWTLSLVGGILLFIYALQRRDPVFIIGQGAGIFIYARNLSLIAGERKRSMAGTDAMKVPQGSTSKRD
ncbi:lipid-A-disaccharide synthase N-terminal domain-containing protein [Consotaella salsifontis]|uniref:Uncharacterized N-terminal domain of lipid-A-disaccharide synthase n=1 Tax=Consotaella salsifontis TaxID=1365950 RepID=A0A1T4L591_9HYPH|nr:lipid-A-disaccharide synthase N-terminal domain-containing protein [Consotaella salsifontis]SJZ49879.1 Uncharacterized N-terminal domain of lipid-A-disaccharide synthase [Consotaella salsifontis]